MNHGRAGARAVILIQFQFHLFGRIPCGEAVQDVATGFPGRFARVEVRLAVQVAVSTVK
jgi:hypothetical protein